MRLWTRDSVLPWQIHPALTPERLIRVGGILRGSRDSAARNAKWSLGDDLWTIGCTAWKRAVRALALASVHEYNEWLSTGFIENIHLIRVGGVPLRHYRGLEDEPVPERYRTGSPGEDQALALAFKNIKLLRGYCRLEISTTTKGFTQDIEFVVVQEDGEKMHPWTIPQYETKAGKRRGSVRLLPAGEPERPQAAPEQDKGV